VREVLRALRDQVRDSGLRAVPFQWPVVSTVQPVIEELLVNPSCAREQDAWAAQLGMSTSSFRRHFRRDTQLTFGAWRKCARLVHALDRLAGGADVARVARELNYRPSAFIHMFRTTLGTTPAQYYRACQLPGRGTPD
jgi:AraC-like DNA-binding protein